MVRPRFSRLGRIGEFLYVRPWFYATVLPFLQVVLARVALGFGWFATLGNEFRVVATSSPYPRAYPATLVERIDISDAVVPALVAQLQQRQSVALPIMEELEGSESEQPVAAFRNSLAAVTRDVVAQIRLRHSAYYISDEILELVAVGIETDNEQARSQSRFGAATVEVPESEGLLPKTSKRAIPPWLDQARESDNDDD